MKAEKRQIKILDVVLVLGTLLFSLFIFELLLRLEDRLFFADSESFELNLGENSYNILRHEGILAPDGRRWIFLGDSFLEGLACGAERNLTGSIAKHLAEKGVKLRPVNLGQPGTSGPTFLRIFAGYSGKYGNIHRVTVVLSSNDVNFDVALCRSGHFYDDILSQFESTRRDIREKCELLSEQEYHPRFGGRYLGGLYLWKLAREMGARIALVLAPEVDIGRVKHARAWTAQVNGYKEILLRSLEGIRDLAREIGANFDVVLYPPVDDLSEDAPFRSIYAQIRQEFEARLESPTYSGYEAFWELEDRPRSMTWSLTNAHPNCEAHAILGDWVMRRVY